MGINSGQVKASRIPKTYIHRCADGCERRPAERASATRTMATAVSRLYTSMRAVYGPKHSHGYVQRVAGIASNPKRISCHVWNAISQHTPFLRANAHHLECRT